MNITQFFFIFIFAFNLPNQLNAACDFDPILSTLNCEDINNLTEILIGPDQVQTLQIIPAQPLQFDDSLDLNGLDDLFANNFNINLNNFIKFDFLSNPFNDLKTKKADSLTLTNLYFDFVFNDEPLSKSCDLSIVNRAFKPLLASFQRVFLNFRLNFSSDVCPLVFQNANIKKLSIAVLNEANTLTFAELKPGANNRTNINSKIDSFEVKNSELLSLDSSLINPSVFEYLTELSFASAVSELKIQQDLFASLRSLRSFSLEMKDFSELMKAENLGWILSLNSGVRVDLSDVGALSSQAARDKQLALGLTDSSLSYTFPEQDFCLFYKFPHDQLVFPIVRTRADLECSCTLLWLVQYWSYYKNGHEMNTSSVRRCLSAPNLDQLVKDCHFWDKLLACDPSLTSTTTTTTTTATQSSASTSTPSTSARASTTASFPLETATPLVVNEFCSVDQASAELSCVDVEDLSEVSLAGVGSIKSLRIKAKNGAKFDDKLDLSGLDGQFSDDFNVYLQNFDGIDFLSNSFSDLRARKADLLSLSSFKLDFIYNEASLSLRCEAELVNRAFTPLFSSFKRIELDSSVVFANRLCPLVFQNAAIKKLTVAKLNAGNSLAFASLKPGLNNRTSLNSKIAELQVLDSDLSELDDGLLNKDVFEHLSSLRYASSSSSLLIQTSLFRPFKYMKLFELSVADLGEYVGRGELSWFGSLNSDVRIDLSSPGELSSEASQQKQLALGLVDLSRSYAFPDADFCLFKRFPHDQLVFPIVRTRADLECSCTLVWLIQYWKYYSNLAELSTPSVSKCRLDDGFDQLVQSCDFRNRVDDCDREQTSTMQESSSSSAITSTTSSTTADITTSTFTSPISTSTSTTPDITTSTSSLATSTTSMSTSSTLTTRSTTITTTEYIGMAQTTMGTDNTGVIVGSVIGGIAGLVLIVFFVFFVFKFLVKKKTVGGILTDASEMKDF